MVSEADKMLHLIEFATGSLFAFFLGRADFSTLLFWVGTVRSADIQAFAGKMY
jgi:hypothetical protein